MFSSLITSPAASCRSGGGDSDSIAHTNGMSACLYRQRLSDTGNGPRRTHHSAWQSVCRAADLHDGGGTSGGGVAGGVTRAGRSDGDAPVEAQAGVVGVSLAPNGKVALLSGLAATAPKTSCAGEVGDAVFSERREAETGLVRVRATSAEVNGDQPAGGVAATTGSRRL